MDGKTLLRDLRQFIQEQSASTWLDDKTSYDYLYKAAVEFVSRTRINTATQTITTVASQREYTLNADFLEMQLSDTDNLPFLKYYDTASYSFIKWREYDAMVYGNQTTAVSVPDTWSITDKTATDNLSFNSTAGSDAVQANGEATLVAAGQTFLTTVSVGDTIHNTTDEASGIVTAVTSDTALEAAMFDGTTNAFTSGNAVIIVPQGRLKLAFDPPPLTSGHTATVFYVQRPNPVYSDYRSYRIPIDYKQALIYYAGWMYKNRDREPNFGEIEFKYFDDQVRKAAYQYGKTLHRKAFRVNYMKSGSQYGSRR